MGNGAHPPLYAALGQDMDLDGTRLMLAFLRAKTVTPLLMGTIERLMTHQPCPIAVLVDETDLGGISELFAAGASAVQMADDPVSSMPGILLSAQAQFRHRQGLLDSLAKARLALAERKTVDRAKGLMMSRFGCTEPEAYQRIRKLAMDRNLTIGEAASHFVATLGTMDTRR